MSGVAARSPSSASGRAGHFHGNDVGGDIQGHRAGTPRHVLKLLAVLAALMAFTGISMTGFACSAGSNPRDRYDSSVAPVESRPDLAPLIKGPVSPDGAQAILATADLALGDHRFGFLLVSQRGIVTAPAATVTSYFYSSADSAGEMREIVLAVFRPWPYGERGLYTTRLRFDKPGRWGVDIEASEIDGPVHRATLYFTVGASTSAPATGAKAIRSNSKAVHDVASLADLTTGSLRDPDLYQLSIADAIDSGIPTVLVIASPAFCINEVCGPQLDVQRQLKDKYKERANFIHVDFYDNPQEIEGDLAKARLSPTVVEWRLPSLEWSFVIDARGVVAARFEGFATFAELEEALLRVL